MTGQEEIRKVRWRTMRGEPETSGKRAGFVALFSLMEQARCSDVRLYNGTPGIFFRENGCARACFTCAVHALLQG
jgi:hypothetical protein